MSSWMSNLYYYLYSAHGVSFSCRHVALSYLHVSGATSRIYIPISNRWHNTPNSWRLKNGQNKGTLKRVQKIYFRKFHNGDEYRPLKGMLVTAEEFSHRERLISQSQQVALTAISTDENSYFLVHLFYKLRLCYRQGRNKLRVSFTLVLAQIVNKFSFPFFFLTKWHLTAILKEQNVTRFWASISSHLLVLHSLQH